MWLKKPFPNGIKFIWGPGQISYLKVLDCDLITVWIGLDSAFLRSSLRNLLGSCLIISLTCYTCSGFSTKTSPCIGKMRFDCSFLPYLVSRCQWLFLTPSFLIIVLSYLQIAAGTLVRPKAKQKPASFLYSGASATAWTPRYVQKMITWLNDVNIWVCTKYNLLETQLLLWSFHFLSGCETFIAEAT